MGPDQLVKLFSQSQLLWIVVVIIAAVFTFRSRAEQTQFKSREADRKDLNRLRNTGDLANAKITRARDEAKNSKTPPSTPLSLPGINLSGEPHEILGIRPDASEAEILRAYKEGIKQYHPDRIQGQARDQIKFYEEASAKLNQAKEKMISKVRTQQ